MRRILQHRKPDDVAYGVKDYLRVEWQRIPKLQRELSDKGVVCLECGLPTLRLVYQQSAVYTVICMSCGHAFRYHATSWDEAKEKYVKVQQRGYKRAKHTIGLDYHDVPTLRNYYDNGDNGWCPFLGLDPAWYKQLTNDMWAITPEGYRFLGYDILNEDGLAKPITW